MKTQIFILILMILSSNALFARKTITVNASNYDIGHNLNLEAVAYLFSNSNDLEEFEMKINDPKHQISNLDLNNDGYVDYLRVLEVRDRGLYLITIQSVLGNNIYQDVATIDVTVKRNKKIHVQVIGNSYIYGPNYIIEPIYVHRPVIFAYFWNPRPVVWASPWHWRHYPKYYHYRSPYAVHIYHHNVHSYYHTRIRCHYTHSRKNHRAIALHKKIHRNDYARIHPNKSFEHRNKGVVNYHDLSARSRYSSGSNQKSANSAHMSKSTYSNMNNRRSANNEKVYDNKKIINIDTPKTKSVRNSNNRREINQSENKTYKYNAPAKKSTTTINKQAQPRRTSTSSKSYSRTNQSRNMQKSTSTRSTSTENKSNTSNRRR